MDSQVCGRDPQQWLWDEKIFFNLRKTEKRNKGELYGFSETAEKKSSQVDFWSMTFSVDSKQVFFIARDDLFREEVKCWKNLKPSIFLHRISSVSRNSILTFARHFFDFSGFTIV